MVKLTHGLLNFFVVVRDIVFAYGLMKWPRTFVPFESIDDILAGKCQASFLLLLENLVVLFHPAAFNCKRLSETDELTGGPHTWAAFMIWGHAKLRENLKSRGWNPTERAALPTPGMLSGSISGFPSLRFFWLACRLASIPVNL